MANKVQQNIQYQGIDSIPSTLTDPSGYHQMSTSGEYCIADAVKGFGQIVKVTASVTNLYDEVVPTPVGRSLEGQKLTGCKLFVVGQVQLTVDYMPCDGSGTVQSVTFKVPFANYIVLGSQYDSSTKLNVKAYIEDIYVKVTSCECLTYGLMLLLVSQA